MAHIIGTLRMVGRGGGGEVDTLKFFGQEWIF